MRGKRKRNLSLPKVNFRGIPTFASCSSTADGTLKKKCVTKKLRAKNGYKNKTADGALKKKCVTKNIYTKPQLMVKNNYAEI